MSDIKIKACERCGQALAAGDLYHRAHRADEGTINGTSLSALVGDVIVHDYPCPEALTIPTTALTDNIDRINVLDGYGTVIRTRYRATNRAKVAAIRQAWRRMMPEEPPITYGDGPTVDLDLYAQVAINVLTDWDKS